MPGTNSTQGESRRLTPPLLHVEGPDDVAVISALLARHGIETKRGSEFLSIEVRGSVEKLLDSMGDAIRVSTGSPVGFVLDIDTRLEDRWKVVRSRLEKIGVSPPDQCPPEGYVAQMTGYPFSFGVWLMPDCRQHSGKLEHLVERLIPENHPLWTFARECVDSAAIRVDEANTGLPVDSTPWKRFTDADRIKAEVRTWLAWQSEPGAPMGAAITYHILKHDSAEALAFIRWLRRLYPNLPREAAATTAT
jgi:hypothetical protein